MKKTLFLSLALMIFSSTSQASVRQFIKTCAWGVVVGATAGVASLALVDKPEDNLSNIAKGASLGLYGGIAYGLYQHNLEKKQEAGLVSIAPRFYEKKLEGFEVSSVVWSF